MSEQMYYVVIANGVLLDLSTDLNLAIEAKQMALEEGKTVSIVSVYSLKELQRELGIAFVEHNS